jgi:hypothetical protein
VTLEVLAGIVGAQATLILALAVMLARTRERLLRLEEWARLAEKRLNGERPIKHLRPGE